MTKIKKVILVLLLFFNIFFLIYLVSPTPTLPPLANSTISLEPGDTGQMKNVTGYYTNMTRTEVMNFYKANYPALLVINLNHPPEKAKQIYRDTMQSYYLEEFVIPFKESLFVNGYEWENDVFTKPEKREQYKLIYDGKLYKSKINTKIIPVSIPKRLFSFFATEASIVFVILLYRSFLKKR